MGKFTLFDEAVLTDISDLKDVEISTEDLKETEASLEAFAIPSSTLIDADVQPPVPPSAKAPPIVQYTISPLPSGTGKMVTFYLNVPELTSRLVNQFIMFLELLVKPTDVVFVHLNSILEVDDSYILHNAIRGCHAKTKIACIPYALNTAAFYPALACDFIMPCKFGLVRFDACSVRAGGVGHIDAKNAYEFDLGRKQHLLNVANEAGFLPEENLKHIFEKQGSYTLYGEAYRNAVMNYNRLKKSPQEQVASTNPSQYPTAQTSQPAQPTQVAPIQN